MSPRTDEFGRIERSTLTTRSISVYTKKKISESAQEKKQRSSRFTSGKPLYRRACEFTDLVKNMGKGKSDREAHKILIISPMNEQPKVFWMSTRA